MKQRDALVATLLSVFIPFYQIYWFYVTAKDMQSKGAKVPSSTLLFIPYVLIFVMFGVLIAGSATVDTAADSAAAGVGLSLGFFLAFILVAGLILYYMYKFSEAVEEITNKELSKVLLFILFWLVSPAGVYLTQDKLNSLAGGKVHSGSAAAPVSGGPPTNPIS